ncbi:MAG: hypothetical protein JWR63_1882 [Conexibacter sp.]|nr:hypothetical protein [Conexibacter sp.]
MYVWTVYGRDHVTCARCKPGDDPDATCRPVGEVDLPPVIVRPLTVAEAAVFAGVSPRTIYRKLAEGAYGEDGAWKEGSGWMIDPDALRAARTKGGQPATRKAKPSVTAKQMAKTTTKTDDMGWPA